MGRMTLIVNINSIKLNLDGTVMKASLFFALQWNPIND